MPPDIYWELGRRGERLIRLWLQGQGFFVVWTADIQTHAPGGPVGNYQDGRTILPDFLASVQGHSRWVEVKTKSRATLHRNSNTWEHGIALRLWDEYLDCEQQTGIEGWLAVFEAVENVRERLILLQSFTELKRSLRVFRDHDNKMGGPMVFFPRTAFNWYPAPKVIPFTVQGIEPVAPRTLAQAAAPTTRQMALFDTQEAAPVRSRWGDEWH